MKVFSLVSSIVVLSLAASAAGAQARLLVAEKSGKALAVVDPVEGTVLATVPEGGTTGHEVVGSPDGKLAFVPIYGSGGVGGPGTNGNNIVVIDLATDQVVGNIQFDHGVRPHCAVFGPKDGLLYVTTELDQSVTVIDPKTLKIVGSIPTGQPEGHMLALSRDGLRGYTANVGPGTVSVLDIKARKTLAVIPISTSTQRIAISPDDRWVFTSDQATPRMAVIDTKTNTVKTWVKLDGTGYGGAVTPDGHWMLMPIPNQSLVDVVDLQSMTVAHAVDGCKSPQEVLVNPNGKSAYVSCPGTNQVAEIDLSTWKVSRMITTGRGPDGLSWAK